MHYYVMAISDRLPGRDCGPAPATDAAQFERAVEQVPACPRRIRRAYERPAVGRAHADSDRRRDRPRQDHVARPALCAALRGSDRHTKGLPCVARFRPRTLARGPERTVMPM